MAEDPATTDAERQAQIDRDKACENEFARFEKERAALTKTEIEAEKNYDTLLVTISTLAIGSAFTLFKDFLRPDGLGTFLLAALALLLLGCCLFVALADRLLTYQHHVKWRETLDEEFRHWHERGPGAMERAEAGYPDSELLPRLKWIGFGTLLAGIFFLTLLVLLSVGKPRTPATPTPPPVVVNVYAATTQPTTQP